MFSVTVMEQLGKLIFHGIEQNTMLRFFWNSCTCKCNSPRNMWNSSSKAQVHNNASLYLQCPFPRRSTLWPAKDKQPSILWTVTMGTTMARLPRHSLPACPEGAWSRDPGRGRGETTGNAADNWRWTTGKMQNEIPRASCCRRMDLQSHTRCIVLLFACMSVCCGFYSTIHVPIHNMRIEVHD